MGTFLSATESRLSTIMPKLPGASADKTVYLPIDSKFPGDTYANLMSAYENGAVDDIKQKRILLVNEIKKCAKSIHDKYIIPPYTTDFAIMFLPFEGVYAEVVNMGLVEDLQKNYKVNIAGPSTMAAMLNSLQMGFRTLAIQKKSGEVWKILESAKKEFSETFGIPMGTLRHWISGDRECPVYTKRMLLFNRDHKVVFVQYLSFFTII